MNAIGFSFAYPWLLACLALLPALGLTGWVIGRRQQRALQQVTGLRAARSPGIRRRGRLFWRLAAMALLIIGAAGPCWGRDPEAPRPQGRDILVVLDISRSMLAEDRPPQSRLERAKAELLALVNALESRGRGTNRIGLIAFAGKAKWLCPLTEDYDHFRHALQIAHPDYLGPAERIDYRPDGVGLGTSLQAALDLAAAALDAAARGFQEILLVSDGDDLAGDWKEGVARCVAGSAPVHVLGVGDPKRDVFIPVGPNEFLRVETNDGRTEKATTRRHDEVLQAIAEQSGGAHLSEENGPQPLATWYVERVLPLPVRERTDDQRPVPMHRYAWFYAAALVLFGLDLVYASLRRRRVDHGSGTV